MSSSAQLSSAQLSSGASNSATPRTAAQALRCVRLCSPMDHSSGQLRRSVVSDSLRPTDHSTPGLPVHHQLPEATQTHVH